MDGMEWEAEDYGEDYPTEWGDSEFFGSPSAAVARRLYSSRQRQRPGPRPGGATPSGVMDRIRQLDERQKTTAIQLAALTQRTAAQQSSEQFGPMATAAVGAYGIGLASNAKDWFTPTLVHGLPLLQLLSASRGRAISAGFKANPWSTLGFPMAVALLALFRNKIPGAGRTGVEPPDLIFSPGVGGRVNVFAKGAKDVVLRYVSGAGAAGALADPNDGSAALMGPVSLGPGESIKIRAFANGIVSPVVPYST